MNKVWKNYGLYILIILMAVSFFSSYYTKAPIEKETTYPEFLKLMENKSIITVAFRQGQDVIIGKTDKNEMVKVINKPNDNGLLSILKKNNIKIISDDPNQSSWWVSGFSSILLPLIIFFALWFFMLSQARKKSVNIEKK